MDPTPDDPLDLSRFAIPLEVFPSPTSARKPPRHRKGQWFLRGPVPWDWVVVAQRLPGEALALGLCLWREVGRCRRRTVTLCLRRPGLPLGLQPARRALRCLEAAGLVSVIRKPGKGLEVTLLDVTPKNGD